MSTTPSSLTEKDAHVHGQRTSHSHASSSRYHSRISVGSLKTAALNILSFLATKKLNDEEQQIDQQRPDTEGDHRSTSSHDSISESDSVFKPCSKDGTRVRTLEECPNGYPRLAAFNASEQNFMLYRSFSCVHARLLLHLQASIQALESELDSLDRLHAQTAEGRSRLVSWDNDVEACEDEKAEGLRTRDDILEELRVKVNQYDELLIKAREIVGFQRPSSRDYRSVRNWFHNVGPVIDEDQDYLSWKEDIITLRHGREWAGFDGLVEELLHKLDGLLIRYIFCTPSQTRKSTDPKTYYFSPSRVSKLVNLIITLVIFCLLAAPVLSMYHLSTLATHEAIFAAIGMLMVFTLLFAAAMAALTKARRHELFAASAAYCAVLVVFIGSTGFH
ncbi:hypothetical protein T440DRAFT_452894 [Plenodomus tracheiphilus IPT5]|uniref:DUF6594 domain-containing protein n=1 Tax=Plenodomus tracheiphilus IPT5 TaxID=1408161 RepID=A0A6A7B337_9PLEO|nr:hypothetical protein T440DRAFT_452894 [Plenodomus tracheiphilus IPT5]